VYLEIQGNGTETGRLKTEQKFLQYVMDVSLEKFFEHLAARSVAIWTCLGFSHVGGSCEPELIRE